MRVLTLMILLMTVSAVDAQKVWTPAYVDSMTYHYYVEGNWDEVVKMGKSAVNQGTDFKYLQQRMGYAYYLKSDYYASMRHYEKALKYDSNDQTSLLYLYYAGLESGNAAYARYYGGKLSADNKRNNHLKTLRPVSILDLEYNYQWNNQLNRSNPQYKRIGISTDLDYSLSVYQTFSKFDQKASYTDAYNDYRSTILQDEYYVLVSKLLTANFGIDVGYHAVKTTINTDVWDLALNELSETSAPVTYSGKLWIGNLHYKWNRLHLGVSASSLTFDYNHILQTGANIGLALPGKAKMFLNNSIFLMNDDNDQWVVSKHSIGLLFFKKYWLELSKTFGSLNNFVDLNGMYVYNSFDPTLAKTDLSLFWYANPHLTFFSCFSLETKLNSALLTNYSQNSLTGGIVWKF